MTTRDQAPALAGRTIGSDRTGNSYTVGELIGQGRFAWVYAGKDVWENELAIKVLKPDADAQPLAPRAAAEFRALFSLRHPFVTYVYDLCEFERLSCLVTERCRGPIATLFGTAGFAGAAWVKPIARCLLQAVDFLHLNGVVHKDIHCGNVFLNWQKGELGAGTNRIVNFKLGDFGTAPPSADTVMSRQRLPPECLDPPRFGPLDRRIDVYHCGLVFLQILKGEQLVFTAEEILAGAPRRLALQLASPYAAALERALRCHVRYRTATAREFWRDLGGG